MNPDDEIELRAAELAATGGPVFELWKVSDEQQLLIAADLDVSGVRRVVLDDGTLFVHHNDREQARLIVEAHARVDVEVIETKDSPVDTQLSGPLETVYTAGDMVQADLIRARLSASGISAVLRYDPLSGMARHIALDKTVEVRVQVADAGRAREELGGVEVDDGGSGEPFESKAWATPARRVASGALLIVVSIVLAAFVLAVLWIVAKRLL